jgi:hypothetical protein
VESRLDTTAPYVNELDSQADGPIVIR